MRGKIAIITVILVALTSVTGLVAVKSYDSTLNI